MAYGDSREVVERAFDDIKTARRFLGSTAFVLQTELHLNAQAFGLSKQAGNPSKEYLKRAKAAEADLSRLFPNYFWGNFQRGSFWYSLAQFERATEAWGDSSFDWNRANLAFALLRDGRIEEARTKAEHIESPLWKLVCFPILTKYERGREITRAAYSQTLELAQTRRVYREPFVLLIPWFLDGSRDETARKASLWLENWGPDDPNGSWSAWNKTCVRYLAKACTKEELIAEAGNRGPTELGMHFYFGVDELMQGHAEAAATEFARGFDPQWEGTFIGSMWSVCLLEELEQRKNVANAIP